MTARDRGLLLQLGRGPARVAVADIPNIDAFSLVTSAQTFDAERGDRGAGHRAAGRCSSRTYGEEGQGDHRRRAGLRRRHQRLLGGQRHRRGAGDRQRRLRGDRVHRLDLRRRRRRRGGQLGPARQAAGPARRRAGPRRLGRRDARRRSRSADDDQPALQLRPADRRQGQGLGHDRRGLDREHRPDRLGRGGGGGPGAEAGVELPGRLAEPLGDRQHARRDGPAARLLLPRDRPADRPARARASTRQGVGVPGLAMYIADRPDPGLRVEPDLGRPRRPRRLRRAALRAGRQRADARVDALHVQGRVPSVRDVQRGSPERRPGRLQPLGARAGVRDRDRRRQAVRAVAPALDLRPRRA